MDTAFIQFSSGSTGQPKGVMLSHKNILSNVRAIETGLGLRKNDIGLSWMPLFHDMGLVGYHLTPLHFGINHFLINTMDFVRKPLLWLDSLEKHAATITAAPNFGQALVLKRLKGDSKKRWNLSRVRLVLNGAEPICVDLMQRFMKEMSGFGLESKAMFPVYGLAEATLAVSFPPLKEGPCIERLDRHELHKHHRAISAKPNDPASISFASEGFPAQGCEVRIVDDSDHIILDDTIGHIQVRGDNVMAGYYDNPAATGEAFCGKWLRTGDLGFIRKDPLYYYSVKTCFFGKFFRWFSRAEALFGCGPLAALCVTGRAKDIIFVNGQNYYAHDLENIAQKTEGVRSDRIAICGWRDPKAESDKLLLFLAAKKTATATIFLKIKKQLQETIGLTVDIMIPLTSNQFPKTSSGKLQRYKLLEQFEQGLFNEAIEKLLPLLKAGEQRFAGHKIPPQTFTEKLLHKLWCEELLLAPEKVGIHDNFAELGGKSIHAVSILAELENHHIYLDSQILEKYKTISGIAGYIDKHPTRVRPTEEGKRKKVFGG